MPKPTKPNANKPAFQPCPDCPSPTACKTMGACLIEGLK